MQCSANALQSLKPNLAGINTSTIVSRIMYHDFLRKITDADWLGSSPFSGCVPGKPTESQCAVQCSGMVLRQSSTCGHMFKPPHFLDAFIQQC